MIIVGTCHIVFTAFAGNLVRTACVDILLRKVRSLMERLVKSLCDVERLCTDIISRAPARAALLIVSLLG